MEFLSLWDKNYARSRGAIPVAQKASAFWAVFRPERWLRAVFCIKKTTGNAGGSKKLLHEGVDKNTVADLAGHGDTSFLERTYCHPQMQLKQEAAKRMSNSLFATLNPELLVS